MSDPLKEMFGDSGMTPEQEKKFYERMAKQKNKEIKALESKKKLKGTPDKKDNIGMKTGGIINKKVGGGDLSKNFFSCSGVISESPNIFFRSDINLLLE